MDPAGKLFENGGPGRCISVGDAQIVEIIHTSASDKTLRRAAGDYDFYPNGGTNQPGCQFFAAFICNHFRAFELYAEAINSPENLISRKCNNYENFTKGVCDDNEVAYFPVAQKIIKPKGTYYLQTDSKPPFGLGKQGSKGSNKNQFI